MGFSDELLQLRRVLRALIDQLPQDYAARYEALARVQACCREACARGLEPSINERMAGSAATAGEAVDGMRAIARWINHDAAELGLAIRCPQSSRAATLAADTARTSRGSAGRFRLQVHDDEGGRHWTLYSAQPPKIQLMARPCKRTIAPPATEPKTKGPSGPRGRFR